MTATTNRCGWCGNDPLYCAYHDSQWGVPAHGDQLLFEMLTLEGAQAGLNWLTILKKRNGYRQAFANFDIEQVSRFGDKEVEQLMQNNAIIRNRRKIQSTINNARSIITVQTNGGNNGSFDAWLWSYVNHTPITNHYRHASDVPASTELSTKLSKDLKKLGFSFVGPTICYALMQSIGMVNDHLISCFRHQEIVNLTTQKDKL